MTTVSSAIRIKLFGEFSLSVDGNAITGLTSERLQALLAFLLLHRTAPQTRQQIAFELWPDVGDAEAKANLRRRLHELKQKIPDSDRYFKAEPKTVQWIQNDDCWLDVAAFETAINHSKETNGDRCEHLKQAADVYQGDLLLSCYDEWIEPFRDRFRQDAITVLDALIPELAKQQQVRSAIGYAQQLQRIDPLYEPAYCHLMRLHAQEGDRASALRVYHQCMNLLQEELGVPPSPYTSKLYEELLTLEDNLPDSNLGGVEDKHGSAQSKSATKTTPTAFVPSKSASRADESSVIYIERPPLELLCQETLVQPGALIRLKSSSRMGKTLMMDQVLAQLKENNLRTVRLSMEMADRKIHFSELNRFLRWLCINISRMLGVPHNIDDYWDEEGMGSKVSCTTYMEEYLLTVDDAPLVLCLDDIDLLFSYPDIYEDFFSLLRSWYELARTYTCPIWKQLRLAIVHATDVYVPLNIHQSPFNVGVPIELEDFTQEQAQRFADCYQLDNLDINSLMEMVGGHPYLLQQAFEYLKGHPDQDLEALLSAAPTDSGIYANLLRGYWLDIREHTELISTLHKLIQADEPIAVDSIDSVILHQLHSIGIIRLQGDLAEPRCQLYRQYFEFRLDSTNTIPASDLKSDDFAFWPL